MTITYDVLIKTVGFILSVSAVVALIWRGFKHIDDMHGNKKEIEEIKEEQQMLCLGIFACLDGLKQLGANGNVTEAHRKLHEYIMNEAHN